MLVIQVTVLLFAGVVEKKRPEIWSPVIIICVRQNGFTLNVQG